jgi:outer membrane biosynthesis protein TonB
MDTEKIVGDVADVVRDLVARTLSQAEERAQEIVDTAEREATEIVDRARREADDIRSKAETEAQGRLKAIQAALAEVQARIGVAGEVPTSPVPEPEPAPPVVPEPSPPPPDPVPSPEPVPEPEPPLIPEPTPPPDEGTPPEVANGTTSDVASARLVAMNLALDGTSSEEAKRQLAAEFSVSDLDSLVDEVYAKVAS